MIKILFFISLLFMNTLAQDQGVINQKINGIIITTEDIYFILDHGFMEVKSNDWYTNYYRRIYNDSTIVNPNTEIVSDFNLNIIPFISPQIEQKRLLFDKPQDYYHLFQQKETGYYRLTSKGKILIDSLLNIE